MGTVKLLVTLNSCGAGVICGIHHTETVLSTTPTLETAAIKVPQQSPPLGSFCLNRRGSNVGGEGGTQRFAFKMD